ncbi:6306_t:CDS:10 [Ambispora gerdemannii]|uniref:6306_t:CDS:1 n=1 Tax=Ambispora gerdemannii TaxID=144530 RepID=A0A9N8YM52_9GLOM|nr:6306_t:CDS:10 [Ambispora gerdemannii]
MWSRFVGQIKNATNVSSTSSQPNVPLRLPEKQFVKRRSIQGSPKSPRLTEAKRRSSLLFGVIDEAVARELASSPRKTIPFEQLQELRSLFQQWQNAFEEKERSILLSKTVRKFCDIYVEAPELVADSLDNLKSFTNVVSKHLIAGIRSVPDTGQRPEASQEILRKLSSREHLFFSLKALNILCNGPPFVLDTIKENGLPTILIKTFSSFIELPLQLDLNTSIKAQAEGISSDLTPVDVVADIFTDILVHFVTNPPILQRLIEEDILVYLVTMILNDKQSKSEDEEKGFFWEARGLEVLTELFSANAVNQELITYFEKKDIMGRLIKILKNGVDVENKRFVYSQQLVLAGSLLIELIQGTVDLSPIFLENFSDLQGYETLFNLLLLPPFDENSSSTKDTVITLVEDLVFAGTDNLKSMASNAAPYQHEDFRLPEEDNENGTLVRNEQALQILVSALVYPEISSQLKAIVTVNSGLSMPESFHKRIVVAITDIIKSNPMNYFITESLNILPTFIEQLDKFGVNVQKSILDLLVFTMADLNYVPFRELIVLSLHFQGQSSKQTTALVCKTVISLLRSSPKFKDVFREIGLLNMLCSLIQDLATALQERFGNTHFVRRISITQLNDILNSQKRGNDQKKLRFGPEVVENFQLISACMVELLKGSKSNISLFGVTFKGNLFDLLQYDETRDGALAIFETLVVDGYILSSNEPQTPKSHRSSSSSVSTIEHSFQFGRLIEIVQTLSRLDLKMKIHILSSMRRILVACPEMKDVFREAGGFVCLVSLLISLEDVYEHLSKQDNNHTIKEQEQSGAIIDLENGDLQHQTIEILKGIFFVFVDAMSNHDFNRRFFSNSIGFKSVEDAIRLTEILGPSGSAEHLFGILFGFALEDESVCDIFVEKCVVNDSQPSKFNEAHQLKINKAFGKVIDEIRNPGVIPTILHLQTYVRYNETLSYEIYEALISLAFANRRNQVTMNQSGVVEILLRRLFSIPESVSESELELRNIPDKMEKRTLTRLAQRLIEMGVSTTEIRFLFEQFENSNETSEEVFIDADGSPMSVMDMVFFGVQRSRWPRFVQFDMSPYGFSCLEMSRLTDRQFPPTSSGYTFLAWLDIESFDPHINLTLLGLSDDEQRCYLHVYIEAHTHKLVVNTSPKQGARFDNHEFRTGCWYHIALVHHRPRAGSISSMSLYVDGRFVENSKCQYLGQPTPNKPIRTFLGTPSDVARQLGKGKSTLAWDLGPCYLFEDDIDGDIISVFYHLGPRYSSNFQDSLGQFQTYQTSTLLNMKLDAMSRKRKDANIELDHLAMVNAIRGNNSQTLPEEKIIFSFSASNVLVSGQNVSILGSGLSEGTIQALEIGSANKKVILNAAVPKVERALRVAHGLAYLKGDPIIAIPYGMDDSIWKIGGSAVVLRLIEKAETTKDLYKAVCTLIELIRFSWRNSEDMERIHGYEILAFLLKQKHELLSLELLNLLLVFVGFNPISPTDSVIVNPLAYRFLILDFELWKRAGETVQRAHLQQFTAFIHLSLHHHFNAKRLSKMRILDIKLYIISDVVKKMLVALKTNAYSKDLLAEFIATLKIVVKYNFTTEVIRAIATFLVSTLNKPSGLHRRQTHVRTLPPDTSSRQVGVMLMEMLTDIVCDKLNPFYINKFSTTITNKWPLLFFGEDSNPSWVVCAARILARLFHSQGSNYITKFRTTSEGFIVMQKLLPQWWYLTQLQQALFAMLFGRDICDVPMDLAFDLFALLTIYKGQNERIYIQCPDVMPIILFMMKEGISAIVQLSREIEDNTLTRGRTQDDSLLQTDKRRLKSYRRKSRSLTRELELARNLMSDLIAAEPAQDATKEQLAKLSQIQQTLVHFIAEMYSTSSEFGELCCKSEVMDNIVEILFPIVCASNEVSVETELNSKDIDLSFDSESSFDVHLGNINPHGLPILTNMKLQKIHIDEPAEELKSFPTGSVSSISRTPLKNSKKSEYAIQKNATVESLLEFVISVSANSVVDANVKSLLGLEMVLRSFPPSLLDHQIHFESYIYLHVVAYLKSTLQLDLNLLADQRIFVNTARFAQHAVDAIYQGWFLNGRNQLYELITIVLEATQRQEEANGKQRASDSTMNILYRSLNRIIVFKLYEISQISPEVSMIWKLLMLQKPNEMNTILKTRVRGIEYKELVEGFSKLLEMEIDSFLEWIETRREQLDSLFQDHFLRLWETVIASEVRNGKESLKNAHSKRMTKLKRVYKRGTFEQDFFDQYKVKTNQWSKHIQDIEISRYYKSLQDNVDHDNYVRAEWAKTSVDLFRERALWGPKSEVDKTSRWRLDFTEGRCRMRRKLERNEDLQVFSYKPKSSKYENTENNNSVTTPPELNNLSKSDTLNVPSVGLKVRKPKKQMTLKPGETEMKMPEDSEDTGQDVDDQIDVDDEMAFEEDKNRKVIRSLEHGDTVLEIFNISRIMGLDACEGLLLLCKQNLYLLDNYFQRSDGEIVDIWDAPVKERDQYLQMLASHASYGTQNPNPSSGNKHKSRKWAFEDIKEVHKRKFLFRDVALELFFSDGRNYLITFNLKERDSAYNKLVARATFSISAAESVMGMGTAATIDGKSPVSPLRLNPAAGLALQLSNFFGNSELTELTQRWEKREISNFQYLMHLNTLAGRSYNDLTQYPVFPWILADYTSEELDLTNPATFRDFSKPMGAQTQERQKEFQIRYRSWDPVINATTPAFHYGTHYSSAMIVCSYLIRLEPFTQQYLKLQGGHFDHADRLFHSISKAWLSASRENMSDVRELIPEFFYLPEFLENINKFNFGVKQASGEVIDSVILPPWAKGDPKIFIHKHREALECEFVSAHLHEWIDLVFGYKQQGPAAIEAVNVFHHLSYEGAIDLDAITDPVERSASTGIIYNFGQTPRQLFTKPHSVRSEVQESNSGSLFKFDESIDTLVQSVMPIQANDRLHVVSTQKLLVPPNYTHYVEWGYADHSLRFHQFDTRKMIGLYESLHLETISCARFADARTFITGGTDAVVCIWRFIWHAKDPQFRFMECLRGHSAKINCLTTSRSYSVIISGSDDKTCIIWDMNRMKYVRQLEGHEAPIQYVSINETTGDIATCCGPTIRLWSINGDLLITKSAVDPVLCCVFYEGKLNEWFESDVVLTGHKKGVVKVWNKTYCEKVDGEKKVWKWCLNHRHTLRHENRIGVKFSADIVALFISANQRALYCGDSIGKVHAWVLPDTKSDLHWMPDSSTDYCLKCGLKFAVLERKLHCKTCGGIFCLSCTFTGIDKSARFCERCSLKLGIPVVQ